MVEHRSLRIDLFVLLKYYQKRKKKDNFNYLSRLPFDVHILPSISDRTMQAKQLSTIFIEIPYYDYSMTYFTIAPISNEFDATPAATYEST
jgi:hypothetical protein